MKNLTGSFRQTVLPIFFSAALGVSAVLVTGCKSSAPIQQAPIVDGDPNDPANANLAPATNVAPGSMQAPVQGSAQPRASYPTTRVAGQAYNEQGQASGEAYPQQQAAPQQNEAYNYQQAPAGAYNGDPNANNNYSGNDDQLYNELLDPNTPEATQPPPPLPEYQQPVAPGPNYLWTPGYWDYANTGYYYVPGNWVSAPFDGALWTPGWWGGYGGGYRWHRGYWGPHVGFYGGVNYGFGYIGFGYQGGYWNHNNFYYNRYANHVDPRVSNYTYQRNISVVNNSYVNNSRVSYYGGAGGLNRRPVPAEFAAARETHIAPLGAQIAERQAAQNNRAQFYSANNGRPAQLFAAHPAVERNVNVPQQLQHQENFNRPGGVNNPNFGAQQQQFRANEQTQRLQADQQRQTQQQQFRGQEQQQRLQANNQQQQRQQAEQQRQTQQQQFRGQEQQQRLQANQQQEQQRQQSDLQRQQQASTQRQQQDQQRAQQQNVQRQQQQQDQQRVQEQQRQQQAQQNVQRQQQDQQRVQQQNVQRQQQDQQRQQQQQQVQRQQQQVQRQQAPAARPAPAEQPARPAPAAQPARPAPAPHAEAPRPAPAAAPHAEGGGGGEHGRH